VTTAATEKYYYQQPERIRVIISEEFTHTQERGTETLEAGDRQEIKKKSER
jgi:hypothetical protein